MFFYTPIDWSSYSVHKSIYVVNKEITCMLNSQYPELSICQKL